MASDVERNCCGANNNIGVLPHGSPSGASAITDGEVLIESEFLELNNQLHYSKTVHILLTDEFVFVKETRDRRDSETHVLQYESGKTVSKFLRSDASIEVCSGCPFTFKAKWSKDMPIWKTYELCGKEEVWPKWLRSFNVEEPQGLEISSSIISGESDSDDGSDDDDSEDVEIPECTLTLSVNQTISTWSVSMFNPSKVRRLAITQQHLPVLPSLASSNASDLEEMFDSLNAGSLYRSNSHPRLSLVRPFRCPSLPNIGDLENVRVDADLRIHECRTRGQTSADDGSLKLNSSALFSREGKSPDKNFTLATLQQKVENLRAHPTNLNFVRRGTQDDTVWEFLATPKHHRKHSLCLAIGNEANRIPMPSDLSSRAVGRSPVLKNRQEILKDDRKVVSNHVTNRRDSSLSPKKQSSKAPDLLTSSKRPHLYHGVPSISEGPNKRGTARRLEFKDDMAVSLSDGDHLDQQPRKEKLKRFWSVLYKKRPKLRTAMQAGESDDLFKENDTSIRSDKENLSNISDADGVVGSVRRGGFSGSFTASKSLTSTKEEGKTPVHNKQGWCNGVFNDNDQFLNSHQF